MREIDELSMEDYNALADLIGCTLIFLFGVLTGFDLCYFIFEVL